MSLRPRLRPRFYHARRFYRAGTPSMRRHRDTRGVRVIRSRGHRALHAIDAPSSLLDAHRAPTAGKFGFIRPRDAKSKDDHAFFNMNELCVFPRPF